MPKTSLRNDLYCVEWGVKLYSNSITIRIFSGLKSMKTDTFMMQTRSCKYIKIIDSVLCVVLTRMFDVHFKITYYLTYYFCYHDEFVYIRCRWFLYIVFLHTFS